MRVALQRLAAGAVIIAAIMASTTGAVAQMRTLRAGGTGVQAPFNFIGADGNLTGIVVDMLALIGAEVGFQVENVVPVPLGEQVAALNDGRIDITGGTFTITAERAALIAFTIPYMVQSEGLVVRADDAADYRSLQDMHGKTIGVVERSGYVSLVEGQPPGTFAAIKYYPLSSDLLVAIRAGEIDGAIYGAPIVAWDLHSGNWPDLRMAPNYVGAASQPYGLGLRKSDSALVDQINVVLQRMMEDGTIREIFTRYGLPYADYTR